MAECRKQLLVIVSIIILSVASSVTGSLVSVKHHGKQPTEVLSRVCSKTRNQSLCLNSLLDFPGSLSASSDMDLIHVSMNVTLKHLEAALSNMKTMPYLSKELIMSSDSSSSKGDDMDKATATLVSSAHDGCLELVQDSMDLLSNSLLSVVTGTSNSGKMERVGSRDDILTWLSAALTNLDTCMEGWSEVGMRGTNFDMTIKDQVEAKLMDLSELVSNCLSVFASVSSNEDFPIRTPRKMLQSSDFPLWMSRRERRLMEMPVGKLQFDIVVAQDGSGTVKTIGEALNMAPDNSVRRITIYVKAGRYEEKNLEVGKKKKNLMFVGDGIGKTIITGGVSVFDHVTTFYTASFAVSGSQFIARDITFENWAGPEKHQAVALRVRADQAVFYRCSFLGYQDTLYVHSFRQFFRECDIYGTVDFIFGDAAVVFQNCNIYARKPMANQVNTITAQGRKSPDQTSGISIHSCRILATPDLEASKAEFQTYLGRPWQLYSRTVYMLSFIGDHIHPSGWSEWAGTFALGTLYYGEYQNNGPGSSVGLRVKWPGYHVMMTIPEASPFTVANLIGGTTWLPSTGVTFLPGLA